MKKIEAIPKSRIAYVDECGIDKYIYREYGWSPRGEKIYSTISGRKYKRVGIVAAQLEKEIIAPLQYDGAMDSILFEAWFEQRLLPSLPANTVIVMDNATFHRKRKLIPMANGRGHEIIFLPPYSPELNLIENFWAWLKRRLKKVIYQFDSLDDAISDSFILFYLYYRVL
jgi:transposase